MLNRASKRKFGTPLCHLEAKRLDTHTHTAPTLKMPAVERPTELDPPVLAVALDVAAVLLLVMLANSAISGAFGSLFTKDYTAAKLPCRDLRGVLKGKVVMYELYGFLHELTRCSLSCTPMAAKTWGMHCTGQSPVQDMYKVADMASRVLDRISVMASGIVDDSGTGRLIVCLEGKNPLKQVSASRTAAKAKAAAKGKWLDACRPTDCLVRAVLGQMETRWPGCTSMAPACSVWVVWPCHDADGQLAMHVLGSEDAYAIVESNDSDMLYFPGVRNMVFAFSINCAGGMKGFVYPNDCTDDMYVSYKVASGEQQTLQSWEAHKRLAAAVLSGCDYFKLSGVGMARAVLIVDKLWDLTAPLLDNLLAVQTEVAEGPTTLAPAGDHQSAITTLDPHTMKVIELRSALQGLGLESAGKKADLVARLQGALAAGAQAAAEGGTLAEGGAPTEGAPATSNTFFEGYCAFLAQNCIVLGNPTAVTKLYPTFSGREHALFPSLLVGDPLAAHRDKPMCESYCHLGDVGCTCVDQHTVEAPDTVDFSTGFTKERAFLDGEATASVPVLRLDTILAWWKGGKDHLTKQADERFRQAWSRGYESSEAVDAACVYVPNTDAGYNATDDKPTKMYITTSVNQSYGSTVKGEEARGKAHYSVVLELEARREDDHYVAHRICGASCPCIHSIIRCTHMLTLALLVFGMKSNSAAVGSAKKAPKKPKNFKGVLRMGYFASQDVGSIEVVLAQMRLTLAEQNAIKEIFNEKKTTKKNKGPARTRGTEQNASLTRYAAATRAAVHECFEKNARADQKGFLAAGLLTAHLGRKFFPTRPSDVGKCTASGVRQSVERMQGLPGGEDAALLASINTRLDGCAVTWN